MKQITFDELMCGTARVAMPSVLLQYEREGAVSTRVLMPGYDAVLVTVAHHKFFALQYSLDWGQGFTYQVSGGESFHDLSLECACGGTLWESGWSEDEGGEDAVWECTSCSSCNREFGDLEHVLLSGRTLHRRPDWLIETVRAGGETELHATLRGAMLEDLCRVLDVQARVA